MGLCKEQSASMAVELPQDRPAVLYKPPFPVVDVNDLWLQQCAFQREEVIGKTIRLIRLINYSKDRQAKRNDFKVVPVGAASKQLLSVST